MIILGTVKNVDRFPLIELSTETGVFKVKLDSYVYKPRVNDVVYVELGQSDDGQILSAIITLNVTAEVGENGDYDFRIKPHNGDVSLLVSNGDRKVIEITNGTTKILMEDNEPLSIEVAGLSLFTVLEELIDNTKGIITEGSPATQKVSQASRLLLDLTKNKLEKVLK